MKRLGSFLILFFSCFLFGQTPPSGISGQAFRNWLKTQFYDSQHQALGYSQARRRMYNFIDNENNKITCVYGGYQRTWQFGGSGTNPWPINAEHTIPQSFFGKSEPMRSDLHHLFPTFADWNSRRSNYPFEDIPDTQTTSWMVNQSVTSSVPSNNINNYSEGTNSRFEPREDHKGNVARAVFYFFTMYPQYDINRVGDPAMFFLWHQQDPVDADEQTRNDRIASYQGNRNPYVDHPEWVAGAWEFTTTTPGGSGLSNNASLGFTLARNAIDTNTINLPANVSTLTVSISGSGGADLYVKNSPVNWPGDQGRHDTSTFKAPYIIGTNESVTFNNPAAGTWHILVHAFKASSGTLTVTWNQSSGTSGSWQYDNNWTRETPHNYANRRTYTYTFQQSGASQVGVHFDTLNTEANYDFVNVYNAQGTRLFSVSGNLINNGSGNVFGRTDGWCIVAGEEIRIELVTDSSITRYGLLMDASAFFP